MPWIYKEENELEAQQSVAFLGTGHMTYWWIITGVKDNPLIPKRFYTIHPTRKTFLGVLGDKSRCTDHSFLPPLPALAIPCIIWPFLHFHWSDFCDSNGTELVVRIPFQLYNIRLVTSRSADQVFLHVCKQKTQQVPYLLVQAMDLHVFSTVRIVRIIIIFVGGYLVIWNELGGMAHVVDANCDSVSHSFHRPK